MLTIVYSPGVQVQQVEIPKEVERSIKGALYIRPGATVSVTEGEAKHLKAQGVKFIEVGAKATAKKKADTAPVKTGEVQPVPGVGAPEAGPSDGAASDGEGKTSFDDDETGREEELAFEHK
jgi:hypothetical protein